MKPILMALGLAACATLIAAGPPSYRPTGPHYEAPYDLGKKKTFPSNRRVYTDGEPRWPRKSELKKSTPHANFELSILEFETRFSLVFKSDTAVREVAVLDAQSGEVLSSTQADDKLSFTVEVPSPLPLITSVRLTVNEGLYEGKQRVYETSFLLQPDAKAEADAKGDSAQAQGLSPTSKASDLSPTAQADPPMPPVEP